MAREASARRQSSAGRPLTSSVKSTAYVNNEHRVWYADMAFGAMASDMIALLRDLARRPEFRPGWRLIADQRRCGTLVRGDLRMAGEMYRAAKRLGHGIRFAVVYERGKPIVGGDVMRNAVGLSKEELQDFDDLSKALNWLDLPEDYDLKAGTAVPSR